MVSIPLSFFLGFLCVVWVRLMHYVYVGLSLATVTIFIRSVFRVAELKGGFHSRLANDEVDFMVLEGAMIVLATLALTVLHPGFCFDGLWKQTKWSRVKAGDVDMAFLDAEGKVRGVGSLDS